MAATKNHIAMFPWFGIGHLTPYLQLSNKLAERGHRVTFLVPTKTRTKLNHLNFHPHLIEFIPLIVPHVEGLPLGAETMLDVPLPKAPLLAIAFDLTKDQVEKTLQNLKPDFVFFDFAYWIPTIAKSLGIISIYYSIFSAAANVYLLVLSKRIEKGQQFAELDLMELPNMQSLPFESLDESASSSEFGNGVSIYQRLTTTMRESEAICIRTCSEIEGPYVDYIEKQYNNNKILLLGPVLPEPSNTPLEERWANWLGGFKKSSVVYCAFGSECVLEMDPFQELILGLELTGLPFLVVLKPPFGVETIEDALPNGFEERVKGRGIVYGGWVQQQLILRHPSVGCFVSHCGFGSMCESLISNCQIVLVPHFGDQFINSMLMTRELKVAMDVERREEDGRFTRESVCKAVKLVMDEESEVGGELKANHNKWKDFLSTEGLESSYINNFILKLQDMPK